MKKSISLLLLSLLMIAPGCQKTKEVVNEYNIVPKPNQILPQEGRFELNSKVCLVVPSDAPEVKSIADSLAERLKQTAGISLKEAESADGKSAICFVVQEGMPKEGYKLSVTPSLITLTASQPNGFFYGVQTLYQLLPPAVYGNQLDKKANWSVPAVEIEDSPRFVHRGLMLDVCRHYVPIDYIYKFIDLLAMNKMNVFHWHLTDDQGWRIEIKKYPKLTEIGSKREKTLVDYYYVNYPQVFDGKEHGGYYTQEQIKDVVAYAASKYINVVPEIEMPGHALAALAAYPELSCDSTQTYKVSPTWGVFEQVFCPSETTFKFFEGVMDEVIELFPSEYIHIGGDECPKTAWKNSAFCQQLIRQLGLKDDTTPSKTDGIKHSKEDKLQSYFVTRMEKYLNGKGRNIIGWDEILEGGLAPSATVMSWRGEEGGIAAANMGHEAIMTPGSGGMYIDQFQGDPKIEPVSIGGYDPLSRVYAYNPIPDTLVATGKANLIKGVQTNLWSEYMYNTDLLEYRAYPRVLALAEIGWTPLARKDYKDFERRLDNALVRLDELNINYHIPQPEQPNGSCDFVAFTDKASLEFKTTRPVKVVYTIDGTEPTPESTAYSAPIEFTESGVLKIRSVLPSGKMSKTRTITVEKQALAPAREVAKTTPGLEMQVTDGMFLNSSKLGDVKEWKKSVIKDLREITSVVKSSESMRGVKQYAAIATGYVNIPEDGVYYISSDNEEVWIDGKLLVNNAGEVKRFSRHDSSAALSKGLHEIKVVFLGHIIGGWPSNWNDGSVKLRKDDSDKFVKITPEMLVH